MLKKYILLLNLIIIAPNAHAFFQEMARNYAIGQVETQLDSEISELRQKAEKHVKTLEEIEKFSKDLKNSIKTAIRTMSYIDKKNVVQEVIKVFEDKTVTYKQEVGKQLQLLKAPTKTQRMMVTGAGLTLIPLTMFLSYKYLIPRLDRYLKRNLWTEKSRKYTIRAAKFGSFVVGALLSYAVYWVADKTLLTEEYQEYYKATHFMLKEAKNIEQRYRTKI